MKTTKKKTSRIKDGVKLACPRVGCSFAAIPMHGIDARKDDGSNNCEAEFKVITDMIERNFQHQTFSINEAYSLSRGLDLDVRAVQRLWADWVRRMLRQKRIVAVEGCYEIPIYRLV